MKTQFGVFFKQARIALDLKIKDVATHLSVDSSLVSRFESGDRMPSKTQLNDWAMFLKIPIKKAMVLYLSEQLIKEYGQDEYILEAFKVAEEKINYHQNRKKQSVPNNLKALIKKIDALKATLDKLRKLDSDKVSAALELEYTYNSNQIEGNTLTLQETDLVINEGMTVDGKSMREHLEAINHYDAIAFVKDLVTKSSAVSEREILQLHSLVLRGIEKNFAGRYRNVQVMITGSLHTSPAPFLVGKHMEDLFLWYADHKNSLHPVILAAEMHERLVSIHPFIDGNGRTSRLLMNLILMQHGYVIADIKGEVRNRLAYYKALESVRLENTNEAFLTFIAQTELDSLQRYVNILNG